MTNTGTSAFSLTIALSGDYTYATNCGATLSGGQSCSIIVSFVPSQPGMRGGLLAVTAGAGTSPAYVSLSGTGTAILPANNGTLNSGSVAVGQPVAQFYKVSQAFTALTATATGPFRVILVEDVGFGPECLRPHPTSAASPARARIVTSACFSNQLPPGRRPNSYAKFSFVRFSLRAGTHRLGSPVGRNFADPTQPGLRDCNDQQQQRCEAVHGHQSEPTRNISPA